MTVMTKERLLDEANHLMRERGYSAFSYADLSKKIGITKASIHHHFPTKDQLGEQVVIMALSEAETVFAAIEANNPTLATRLTGYMRIFSDSYHVSKLPLCCALSADMANLPENVKVQAVAYFDMQIRWLTKIIGQAIAKKQISEVAAPDKIALLIITICEGASVVARATKNSEIFDTSIEQILTMLS